MAGLNIIYEDQHILAIDKPAGIICFGENEYQENESSMAKMLLETYPEQAQIGEPPRYGIAHRLDKETSGLLLIAKDNETLSWLQEGFKDHGVSKTYLALVTGKLPQSQGTIEAVIGRHPSDRTKQAAFLPIDPQAQKKGIRPAITNWKKVKEFANYTLVEAQPETGRRHQIRVHFQFIGHPLTGDKVYGFKDQPLPQGLTRHFLHAAKVSLKNKDGQTLTLECPLPPDLEIVLKNLK